MRWRALGAGEWPRGVHWTVGEVRVLPIGYPGTDEPCPAWLVELDDETPPAPAKAKGKRGEEG